MKQRALIAILAAATILSQPVFADSTDTDSYMTEIDTDATEVVGLSIPPFRYPGTETDAAYRQAACDYLTGTISQRYNVNNMVVATVPVLNIMSSYRAGNSLYLYGSFSVYNFSSKDGTMLNVLSGGTDTGYLVVDAHEDGTYSVNEERSLLTGDSTEELVTDESSTEAVPDSIDSVVPSTESQAPAADQKTTIEANGSTVELNETLLNSALSYNAYADSNERADLLQTFIDDTERQTRLTRAYIASYISQNSLSYTDYTFGAEEDKLSLNEELTLSNPMIGTWLSASNSSWHVSIAQEGNAMAVIIIDVTDSANQTTEWILHGTCFDGSFSYVFGQKTVKTFDDAGNETDSVQYTDGSGLMTFHSDTNTITWSDDKADSGNGMTFQPAY